ncbi:hypothetical protein AB4Z17_13820 [Paenibacillus sp. TAF43_2]|uniref:hypothetical protein n=1 Tax=Paenibacillus sp. TAF43_2 TaxID=3233069 RepID=UPI003F998E5F
MFRITTTHWKWTAVAEAKWQQHNVNPRRADQILMERDRDGEWVNRKTVPLSWVEKVYVQEAEVEQINLI